MKLTQRQILFLATGSAIMAVLFTHSYLSSRRGELDAFGEAVNVLIARQDILEGTQIDNKTVEVTGIPKKFVQPGVLMKDKDLLNRVAIAPIKKGEQITDTKLVFPSLQSGMAGVVRKGMRAVTISVNDIKSVGGFIRPGDFVDVLATFDFGNDASVKSYTYTILEGAEVIASGGDAGVGLGPRPADKKDGGLFGIGRTDGQKSVTLMLQPQDVQKVVLAEEVASIRLSLRNPRDDTKPLLLEPATTVSVTGLHELLRPRARPTYREYRGGQR